MRNAPRRDWLVPFLLLCGLAVLWVWAAIGPTSRSDWWIENILVFLLVPAVVSSFWWHRLSTPSYVLLAAFTALHIVGSHWTYSNVPLPWHEWGFERNHYDRVVHLGYGALLTLPLAEFLARWLPGRFWPLAVSFLAVGTTSGFYEVLEWGVAMVAAPALADDFLGAQGDPFDAVKDIGLAMLGSAVVGVVGWMMGWGRGAKVAEG